MCLENAATITEALELASELDKEIDWRIRQYAKCIGHVTANYKEWLRQDYKQRLTQLVTRMMQRREGVVRLAG
jgi:iron-sulfur cluster repair protein YtfE (RIC family)